MNDYLVPAMEIRTPFKHNDQDADLLVSLYHGRPETDDMPFVRVTMAVIVGGRGERIQCQFGADEFRAFAAVLETMADEGWRLR